MRTKMQFSYKCTLLPCLLFFILVYTSCSNGSQNQAHTLYRYTLENLQTTTFHVNDKVTLTWKATQMPNSSITVPSTKPAPIVLEATLSLPFSSATAVKSSGTNDNGVTVSVKVETNDWTNHTYTKVLTLPSSPGYYKITYVNTVYDSNTNTAVQSETAEGTLTIIP